MLFFKKTAPPHAICLRIAQAQVLPLAKALGFRKLGNAFNRAAEDGLIQVFTFQSGQPVSSKYGSFTVNLGVYVPCIASLEEHVPKGRAVHEYHCDIRERLGVISERRHDHWWKLDGTAERSGREICGSLERYGVPLLDKYRSYRSIVNAVKGGETLPFCNAARSALMAAVVARHIGEPALAADLFARAEELAGDHAGFRAHIRRIAALPRSA